MIMSIKRATNTVTWIVRRWRAALSPKLIAITVSEADLQPPKLAKLAESESHPSMLTIDIIGTLKATFRMGDRIFATVKRPMRPARSQSDRFSERLGERSERAQLSVFLRKRSNRSCGGPVSLCVDTGKHPIARRSRRRANGTTSRYDRRRTFNATICQSCARWRASGKLLKAATRCSWIAETDCDRRLGQTGVKIGRWPRGNPRRCRLSKLTARPQAVRELRAVKDDHDREWRPPFVKSGLLAAQTMKYGIILARYVARSCVTKSRIELPKSRICAHLYSHRYSNKIDHRDGLTRSNQRKFLWVIRRIVFAPHRCNRQCGILMIIGKYIFRPTPATSKLN